MKKAFTMVELIFVIVIIGILAGVAIPKLNLVSINAKQANLESFVSVLNYTIGPSMWKKALKDNNGDITVAGYCDSLVDDYLKELPDEITAFSDGCAVTVDTAIANDGVVTFVAGSTIESPSWTLDKSKYK